MKRLRLLIPLILIGAGIRYYMTRPGPSELTLTGIVETNDVIVSPQIAGQIGKLLVREGDTVAAKQLIASIEPQELQADRAFYEHSAEGTSSQVRQSEAELRFQERQTESQIQEAEASLTATIAQQGEAKAALENAQINLDRATSLMKQGIAPVQQYDQARTSYDGARAHLDAVVKQVGVQEAAVNLAHTSAEQITVKRGQLAASEHERAAALAQKSKADVRLSYAELRAPISGIVDVLAARTGEVVNVGQPVVTLIDPDDLWIRVDVEGNLCRPHPHGRQAPDPPAFRRDAHWNRILSCRRWRIRYPARRQPDKTRYPDF